MDARQTLLIGASLFFIGSGVCHATAVNVCQSGPSGETTTAVFNYSTGRLDCITTGGGGGTAVNPSTGPWSIKNRLNVFDSNSDFTVFMGTLPVNSGFGPQVTNTLLWNRAKVDGFTPGTLTIVNSTTPIMTTSGGAAYIPASAFSMDIGSEGFSFLHHDVTDPVGTAFFNANNSEVGIHSYLPINFYNGLSIGASIYMNGPLLTIENGHDSIEIGHTNTSQDVTLGARDIDLEGLDGTVIHDLANIYVNSPIVEFDSPALTFDHDFVATGKIYNSFSAGTERSMLDISTNKYFKLEAGNGSVDGDESFITCGSGGADYTIEQKGASGSHCTMFMDDGTSQMDWVSGDDVYNPRVDQYGVAAPKYWFIPGVTAPSGKTFKTDPVIIGIDSKRDVINGSTVTNGHNLIIRAEDNSNTGTGNPGGDLYLQPGIGKSTGTVYISSFTGGGSVWLGNQQSTITLASNVTSYLQILAAGTTSYQVRTSTGADLRIDAGGLRSLLLGTAPSGEAITIGASSGANGTTVQGNPLTLGNPSYATVMNGSGSGLTINEPVKVNTSVIYSGAVDANLWLNNPSSAGVFRLEGLDYAKFEFGASHSGTTNTGKWQWYVRNDGVNPPYMHLGLLNDAENSEQTGFNIYRSGNSATTFELGGTAQLMDGNLTVYGNTGTDIFKAQSTGGTTDVRMTGDSQANQYLAQFYFDDPELSGDPRVMGFQPRFDGSSPGDFTYTGAITKLNDVGSLRTPIVFGYDDSVSIGLGLSDWNQADASLEVAGTFHVTSTSQFDGSIGSVNAATVNASSINVTTSGNLYSAGAKVGLDFSAYVSLGTPFTLTTTTNTINVGSSSMTITLASSGTYSLNGFTTLFENGSTFAANDFITMHIYRQNNTPGKITNSQVWYETPVAVSALTATIGQMRTPPDLKYTTTNTNDVLSLQIQISASPGAGSVQSKESGLVATRLY